MNRPAIGAIERALWVLPECEHAEFGRAIAKRAAEWQQAGAAGRQTPPIPKVIVRVAPALNIVPGMCQEGDSDPPDDEGRAA